MLNCKEYVTPTTVPTVGSEVDAKEFTNFCDIKSRTEKKRRIL